MQFVFGSEVDYVEGLQGAGFQVNNPNVVAACGCGSSFQVKDDADAETSGRLARYSICSGGDWAGGPADDAVAGAASGCSTPSASPNSPASNISSTMSAPPSSLPLT